MKYMLFVSLLLVSSGLLAQEGFSTLEEQMTGKEFMATGLNKLSDEELAALNAWLRAHSVATLKVARQPNEEDWDTRGFESKVADTLDDSDIVSRLVGTFSGWDGTTVFKLENGQIWKQADRSVFGAPDTENPAVTISQGMFKAWRLKVEGFGKRVRVERIQ